MGCGNTKHSVDIIDPPQKIQKPITANEISPNPQKSVTAEPSNDLTKSKCLQVSTKAEDIEGISANPDLDYDFSSLSMTDMISNAKVIVDTVIKLIQGYLAKNQLLKAVCRRMQSLEPCFESLKAKNSEITKNLVINLIHIVNRIKNACEKMLAGKTSLWEKFKDVFTAKKQIEELSELNDLLTKAQNDLQLPLAVETQKKMDQNFKKIFDLLEKGKNTFEEVKEKPVLPLAKTMLTNEEAFIFWFNTFPDKYAVPEKEFLITLKDYIFAHHEARLNQDQLNKIMGLIKGTDPINEGFINACQVNDFYCSVPLEIDWRNFTTFEKEINDEQKQRLDQITQIKQKVDEDLQKKVEKLKVSEIEEEKKLSQNTNFVKILIQSADYKSKKKPEIPINFRSFFINPADGEVIAFGGDKKKKIILKGNLDENGSGKLNFLFGEETQEMEGSLIVEETTIRLEGIKQKNKIRIYFELDYWFGYYEEEGTPQNMNVFLKIVGSNVVGLSTDTIGVACWQGTLKNNNLNLKKKYLDKHIIIYQGGIKEISGSSEIKGKWIYEEYKGNFYLSQQLFDEENEEYNDEEEEGVEVERLGQEEEVFTQCANEHELKWSNKSYPGGATYGCDNCGDYDKDTSAGRWHCSICSYDICGKCRKIPLENAKKCKNNHILNWSASQGNYSIPLYNCDICEDSNKNVTKGRWHCVKCSFDICPNCRGREEK